VARLLVVITAHVCNKENARLLDSTLASVAQKASGADVVVFDSVSPWPISELVRAYPNVTAHRLQGDHGQLGALRAIEALKPVSSGLVFLQHSTQLTRCLADVIAKARQRNCSAGYLSRLANMTRPFWTKHAVAGQFLATLGAPQGLSPPWSFSVAEHSAIYLDRVAWQRSSELGLWQGSKKPELPAIRTLIDGPVVQNNTELVNLVNQAVEVLAGFLVSWSNDAIGPAVGRQHARAHPACGQSMYAVAKTHGGSFKTHCTPWAAWKPPPRGEGGLPLASAGQQATNWSSGVAAVAGTSSPSPLPLAVPLVEVLAASAGAPLNRKALEAGETRV
jgi:hypothetical protein